MNGIKVSVIIPVYNVEEYLAECLDSVLNQTLSPIEIICINDGCTDQSVRMLGAYAEKYSNIYIHHQINSGQSGARNIGIQLAKGEYLYFLDSDDILYHHALELLYNKAIENDLDNIFFSAITFFSGNIASQKYTSFSSAYLKKHPYPDILPGLTMISKISENNEYTVSVCLQFFKRTTILEHEIRFREGVIHEDNLFTLQYAMVAQRTLCISDVLYRRRVRAQSTMTQNKTSRNAIGYFLYFLELIKLYPMQFESPQIQEFIKRNSIGAYKNAMRIYSSLTPEEKRNFNWEDDELARAWFSLLIAQVDALKK